MRISTSHNPELMCTSFERETDVTNYYEAYVCLTALDHVIAAKGHKPEELGEVAPWFSVCRIIKDGISSRESELSREANGSHSMNGNNGNEKALITVDFTLENVGLLLGSLDHFASEGYSRAVGTMSRAGDCSVIMQEAFVAQRIVQQIREQTRPAEIKAVDPFPSAQQPFGFSRALLQ